MKQCKDIMTQNPKCASPSDTLEAAACRMRDEDIGSLPVCDPTTKKLIGIVTDRDITVKDVASGHNPREATVDTAMTRDPLCCREEEDAKVAMELMAEHQIRRIPVVDAENCLVGIISQSDIATRVDKAKKTANIVKEVSKPPTEQYRQEHALG